MNDMNVLIRLSGVAAMQRIGFTQDDVADGSGVDDRGFMLLSGEEVSFVLASGDSVYANGSLLDNGNGPAAVLSILATKVV
ncbi:hypothetical protein [Kribbella sp. NPDC050470]|uniref:hypothetical protein n=1 Tax=unclassified Kribbella TaxID=2644121 RepID=UPI00379A147E